MSKIILVTGASTGFGYDTAQTLASSGHTVFASMRDPQGKNREHAEALREKEIQVVALDVTSNDSVNSGVSNVLAKAGRIDVLINNAGIASAGVSEAFTDEQVTSLFDVNVIGLHRVTKAVLPTFRNQGDGLIINIGSILGRVTFPFFGIYGASKYAVEAMTDSLRYETSQFGLDVSLIQPSAYPTNMYASVLQPKDADTIEEYGEIGQIPNAMFGSFMEMFEAADGPDAHDVAKAIVGLVDTPKGKRPARTVVGTSFGADDLNKVIAPVQSSVIKALGLEYLDDAI